MKRLLKKTSVFFFGGGGGAIVEPIVWLIFFNECTSWPLDKNETKDARHEKNISIRHLSCLPRTLSNDGVGVARGARYFQEMRRRELVLKTGDFVKK